MERQRVDAPAGLLYDTSQPLEKITMVNIIGLSAANTARFLTGGGNRAVGGMSVPCGGGDT